MVMFILYYLYSNIRSDIRKKYGGSYLMMILKLISITILNGKYQFIPDIILEQAVHIWMANS